MKRFTATEKWADPWFRKLDIEAKMLWLWLLDNCDCAGIIEPDMELARFQIGASNDLERTLASLGDRVERRGDKLFVPKFIPYQYGPVLNPENKAHKGVLKRLSEIESIPSESNESKDLHSPFQGASEGLASPPGIGIGIGEGVRTGIGVRAKFTKPSPEEVTDYAKTINFKLDGNEFCDFYASKGWIIGKSPMKDWQAAVRTWKKHAKPEQIADPPKTKIFID